MGLDDSFQGFAKELAELPGKYAAPKGRLMLALAGKEPAGTIALRPLDSIPDSCEAKRLYVQPAYRGLGIGRALLTRLLKEAILIGYHEIYGDTLPSMTHALRMYEALGFLRTSAYTPDPTPGAVYLKRSLP